MHQTLDNHSGCSSEWSDRSQTHAYAGKAHVCHTKPALCNPMGHMGRAVRHVSDRLSDTRAVVRCNRVPYALVSTSCKQHILHGSCDSALPSILNPEPTTVHTPNSVPLNKRDNLSPLNFVNTCFRVKKLSLGIRDLRCHQRSRLLHKQDISTKGTHRYGENTFWLPRSLCSLRLTERKT